MSVVAVVECECKFVKETKSERISRTYGFGIPMRQRMANIIKSNELILEMSFMLFVLYLRQRFDQRFRRARCSMPHAKKSKHKIKSTHWIRGEFEFYYRIQHPVSSHKLYLKFL